MSRRIGLSLFLLTALSITLFAANVIAVAPSPELIEKWKAEGILEQKLTWLNSLKGAGIDTPSERPAWHKDRYAAAAALNPDAVDTVRLLVVLADFPDNHFTNPAGGIVNAFDSILFSDKSKAGPKNPTGSMIDYYREVSYGKLLVQGHIYGPYTASNNYSYYVGNDNGFSHSPGLVREILTLAQNDIAFNDFVEPGTTIIPNVAVIHAGVGAEGGGNGIWSHKSSVGSFVLKGFSFVDYNMDPELMGPGALSAIGVFCHEFGHILGLPDLYDTQYNPGSNGIGNWSLMASGNYNGNSQSPSELDAWCKLQLGFIPNESVKVVSANQYNSAIPAIEYNEVVYKIPDSTWTDPGNPLLRYYSQEYFLVENRQKFGSDVGLPGSGLLIYHIDNNVSSNDNPSRYHVAVEQADGFNGLAIGGSRGDAGDPWPGSSNSRTFDNFSNPNTRLNSSGVVTEVGVWNISNSDSIMHANFDYNYSHPNLVLTGADSLLFLDTASGGNHDSIIEPGETITFYCRAIDNMRPAYNWTVHMLCDDSDVVFTRNDVVQGIGNLFTPLLGARKSDSAVIFHLAPGAKGKFGHFTLTITADSVFHSGDRAFSKTWQFTKALGTPTVLVVDDDAGQSNELAYKSILERIDYPYRVWNKAGGSPTATDLGGFKSVFWVLNDSLPNGTINAADITALKTFLDNGGNLSIASTNAGPQLQALDSTFLHSYLHAQLGDPIDAGAYFFGTTGSAVFDGVKFKLAGDAPDAAYSFQNLTPINGGEAGFWSSFRFNGNPDQGTCGVTYSGSYKTVILSFPAEYLSYTDSSSGFNYPDSLLKRILQFFGGNATAVHDHGDGSVPRSFALRQNYPNPFNPSTIIAYTIPAEAGANSSRSRTVLEVYNMLGQKVKTLVDAAQSPGDYKTTWDGTNQAGARVSSGIYLYRLTRGDLVASKKMVLLK